MKKPLKKLAVIRSNRSRACPFGLTIPEACQSVGQAIRQMTPLEMVEEPSETQESNQDILLWSATGERCPFAKDILVNHGAVQCEFDLDNQDHLPVGSNYYHKHFSDTSWEGTFTWPGPYVGPSIDRGLYYGQYSVEGQSKEKKK